MIRLTAAGRPVYLVVLKSGYRVKWGRTVIAQHNNWRSALAEILQLFKENEP